MLPIVNDLDDATAIRVLRTFASAQARRGENKTQLSIEFRHLLAEASGPTTAAGMVTAGELARAALEVAAENSTYHDQLIALITNDLPQKFVDPATVAVGVAALIALQTSVKFERSKDGKFSLKIEKQALPTELIKKLVAYFNNHPSGLSI